MQTIEVNQNGKVFEIQVPDGQDPGDAVKQVFSHSGGEETRSPLKQAGDTVMKAALLPTQGLTKLGNAVQEKFQQGGEAAAEAIGKRGYPTVGAAVGTGIAMAPDIAGAVVPIGEAKTLARGVEEAPNVLRTMAQKMIPDSLVGQGANAARTEGLKALQPLQDQLLAAQNAKTAIPAQIAEKGKMLQGLKSQAGKAIGEAEEKMGIAFKEIPATMSDVLSNPDNARTFGNTMRKFADTPVDELAKKFSAKEIQIMRKTAGAFKDIGANVDKITGANIAKGGEQAGKVLDSMNESFKNARSAWAQANDALMNLNTEKNMKLADQTRAINKVKLAIQRTKQATQIAVNKGASRDDVRKFVLKSLGVGGATIAGLKHFGVF